MGSIVSLTAASRTAAPRAKSLADFAEHLFIDGGNVLKVSHSKRVDEPAKFFSWAFRIENRGWLFVSDGLRRFGLASEVIFGIETNDLKPPIGAFSFLEALYRAAVIGSLDLRDGGLASVDPSTIYDQQPPSVKFVSSLLVRISIAQLNEHCLITALSPGAQNALSSLIDTARGAFLLVPITSIEMAAYNTGGSTRVLSALAYQDITRLTVEPWPPLPIFTNPNRLESIASVGALESVLKETVQADLRGSTAVLESTNEAENEAPARPMRRRVTLRLRREHTSLIKSLFAELPIESAFVILTKTDPAADSLLVWSPGAPGRRNAILRSPKAESYTPGISKLAGSFVAFLTDQQKDDTITFEDGFFVRMTIPTWKRVRDCLAEGNDVTVASTTTCPLLGSKDAAESTWIESFTCKFESAET